MTALKAASERLRTLALSAKPGELIGGEESLISGLGFSRSTIRQAARLLEREGLLRVKRGPAGGYFASRPDAETIEATVSAYLETLAMDAEDVTLIASALWTEVVRKAARRRTDESAAVAISLRDRVQAIKPRAPFVQVRTLEGETREAIFALADSKYVELIFNINTAFARRTFAASPGELDEGEEHLEFVRAWRNAKVMELTAIAEGDEELAVMAARHLRRVWHERIWAHRRQL